MKTKLHFYAIQKFKNVTKISGIFTFLIIFFMTFTSFSQSNGISFTCDTFIFNFEGPPAGVINAAQEDEEIRLYPYWTGGTVVGFPGEFVLFVQNDNSTGTGADRWEVHPDIVHPDFGSFPGIDVGPEDPPTEGTYGVLYFHSYDFNGVLPSCVNDWTANPQVVGSLCSTVTVTCHEVPPEPIEEICDGIDNDGDGEIDEGLDCDSEYVIVALDEVHLHDNNTVSGNIGVTEYNGKVKLHVMTTVSGTVEASDIDIDDGSSAEEILLQPAVVDLPPFVYNSVSKDSNLDITVEPGQTITLDGQVYGKIKVEQGGTVIFTNTNVYLEELKTYDNATVDFQNGCTNLFINKKVKLEDNTSFNSAGKSVTMYVDDKVDVEEGSDVTAYIYANKHIDVKAQDDNRTNMTGFFSGKKVKGDKNVSWTGQTGYAPCEIVEPDITEEDVCDCKGGMISLTFTYSGAYETLLTTNSGMITENENIDGTYTVYNDGEKLKKNLEIGDGEMELSSFATIHTSCSQEILGVTYDEVFTVVAHTDTEGNTCQTDVNSRTAIGIEPVESFSGFAVKVWPNPSENNFNIRITTLDDLNKVDIQVIDITGKRIYNDTINWNVDYEFGEKLQSGMYFVKITQANTTEVIKVIKR